MKKNLKEIIISLLWAVDDAIYELKKRFRKGDMKSLQTSLDLEHSLRDNYNEVHGTEYTTKRAVGLLRQTMELLENNL